MSAPNFEQNTTLSRRSFIVGSAAIAGGQIGAHLGGPIGRGIGESLGAILGLPLVVTLLVLCFRQDSAKAGLNLDRKSVV